LSAPSYTRPPEFRGFRVPEVLLSGDHGKIARWRISEGKRLTDARLERDESSEE
jgi:tRNA (guanine37-N1)-methyltransferase